MLKERGRLTGSPLLRDLAPALEADRAESRHNRHEIPAGDEIAAILGIWPGLPGWSRYWDVTKAPLGP